MVDAVYDWSRFNSLPQGYDWIRAELARDPAVASEMARVALRHGNVSTLRRLARLLECEGAEPVVLSMNKAVSLAATVLVACSYLVGRVLRWHDDDPGRKLVVVSATVASGPLSFDIECCILPCTVKSRISVKDVCRSCPVRD